MNGTRQADPSGYGRKKIDGLLKHVCSKNILLLKPNSFERRPKERFLRGTQFLVVAASRSHTGSLIIRELQVARRIKGPNMRVNKVVQSIKTVKIRVNSTKTRKLGVKSV